MAAEVDAYLGYQGVTLGILGRRNLNRGDEVLLAVGTQLANGQLGAGEDDGLGQVLQHVAQG